MERIKIMYVVLEMDLGGLQRIVNLLIRRINKERFSPLLCCLDRGGLFYDELKTVCSDAWILKRRPGPFDGKLFAELIRIIWRHRIDVIHSHNGCSFYSALAGRLGGVKGIVHTDHGRLVPDKASAIWEDRIASCMMDRVIGVSEPLTEYLGSKVKVPRKKLLTITNGVDTQRFIPWDSDRKREARGSFGLNGTDKILGTVCRLDPVKNLKFLIGCMPSIFERVTECKLLIVGDGPGDRDLIEYAKGFGLEGKVIFMGRSAEIERILPVFDIYACTSLSEGTSMTILEAMSCGLPIVASAVGGNPKLVSDSNGILFPLNDGEVFKESVIDLLGDPERLTSLGRNSRQAVELKFSFDRVVKQYEELYVSLSER